MDDRITSEALGLSCVETKAANNKDAPICDPNGLQYNVTFILKSNLYLKTIIIVFIGFLKDVC